MATATSSSLLINTAEQVTGQWLGSVLGIGEVAIDSVRRIGTGQMSLSYRVLFRAQLGSSATPGSVIVKLAADDASSRATGVGMGAYRREVAFYTDVPTGGGPLPACHLAVYDEQDGWFTLVLQDVVGAEVGDQISGCSEHEARLAMRALARLHAPTFNDQAVGVSGYLNLPNPLDQSLLSALLPAFLERYGDRITAEHADVCRRFVAVLDAWAADRRGPMGLVHGDFRLDNVLFTDDACTVVDWQTVTWGPVMRDAAYFIGSSLVVDDRRLLEQGLVRCYHDALVDLGVSNFEWDQCWEEYRRQTFACLVVNIAAGVIVERTDRGDDMFVTVCARVCQQILDLDALELLPVKNAPPVALRPSPSDEGRHTPGSELTWNESWYFDAVDQSQSLGVYVRMGLIPNQRRCFYVACIVRPDEPTLLLLDEWAPLPVPDGAVEAIVTDSIDARHECMEPLNQFHVGLEGTAQAHRDHAGPLRGEDGEPVPVALDLSWRTDGIPYAWRAASRYEIPCRVTGSIRIGDLELNLAGPGQRDHSWGSRDWWANDWMWSAFHFDDGTRTHTVTVPKMPGDVAVGYVQRDDQLLEIRTGTTIETVDSAGLITSARVETGPDELTLDVIPLAFGALRLVSPDGRVTHFPRAMARVRAGDGRTGVGWIEWNRNQGGERD